MARIEPHFGHTAGVPLASLFRNRQALRDALIHRPLQAGIDGNGDGAYSIVVSGGYVDDADHGDRIIYTGQGGNDPSTKRQTADQGWVRGNLGLSVNAENGFPVRVIRGHKGDKPYAPKEGYRYDGVFLVTRAWQETGVDGFLICRFELVLDESLVPDIDRAAAPWEIDEPTAPNARPAVQKPHPKTPTNQQPAAVKDLTDRLTKPGMKQGWIIDLIASPEFLNHREKVGGRFSASQAQALLAWLDANNGAMSIDELASALEIPAPRVRRLVPALTRYFNLEGYQVLALAEDRVALDSVLAKRQFAG